jgi:hypothetical protein
MKANAALGAARDENDTGIVSLHASSSVGELSQAKGKKIV